MKVAITCDYLLEKNHYVEVVESVCELFPEARLYCFAHREGMALAHIDQRMITSSYLSKKVKTEKEFYAHSYQIPSLAKKLFVPDEYDLIINISRGLSQGIKKGDKTRLITYLYDFGFENKIRKSFVQKLFYPFVVSWVKKKLKKSDTVIVSRADIKEEINAFVPNAEVLLPPFRASDYSIFPKAMFKHDYFVIEAAGLSVKERSELSSWMNEWGLALKFVGSDKPCGQEHAQMLAGAKALISFNDQQFPSWVLSTMACGRPVILGNELKKWVHGTGTFFVSFHKGSIKAMIDEVFANEDELLGEKIRSHVLEYDDLKFKAHIKRVSDLN